MLLHIFWSCPRPDCFWKEVRRIPQKFTIGCQRILPFIFFRSQTFRLKLIGNQLCAIFLTLKNHAFCSRGKIHNLPPLGSGSTGQKSSTRWRTLCFLLKINTQHCMAKPGSFGTYIYFEEGKALLKTSPVGCRVPPSRLPRSAVSYSPLAPFFGCEIGYLLEHSMLGNNDRTVVISLRSGFQSMSTLLYWFASSIYVGSSQEKQLLFCILARSLCFWSVICALQVVWFPSSFSIQLVGCCNS